MRTLDWSQIDGPYENRRTQSAGRLERGGLVTTAHLPDDSTRRRTVLLVEDDAAVRLSLVTALVHHGFDILEAESGDEALNLVQNRTETIDVAIIDMAMPLMWGDELAQRLAIVSPSTQIIFISGHSEDFLRSTAALAGNETFFAKPFSPKLLLIKLKEMLGIEDAVVPGPGVTLPAPDDSHAQSPHFTEHPDLHMETDHHVE